MQDLIEKHHWDHELKKLDRLDDVWKNRMKILRMNENRLTERNVPRLMVFFNDCKLIDFDVSRKLTYYLNRYHLLY